MIDVTKKCITRIEMEDYLVQAGLWMRVSLDCMSDDQINRAFERQLERDAELRTAGIPKAQYRSVK